MKLQHALSLQVLVLGVLIASVVSVTAATPVLLGLWRFEEAEGDVAKDSSGLGHDGTLMGENGNVPTRVAGQAGFGGALQFVNNGVDHSYVEIAADPLLKIGMTANDTWTLAIWANESSEGTADYVATYGRFLAQDQGFGIQWDSGASADPQVYLWHGNLAAWRIGFGALADVPSLLDRWVHWALVYDGQNLTLYRNGNQGTQGAKTAVPVHASLNFSGYSGAIQIGSQLNMDGTRNWHGQLDDVAVFNGALAETEIRTILAGDFSAYIGGALPRIVEEPADQACLQGLDANWSVTATGFGSLAYQWRFNGADLPGATNASLTITNVQLIQAGTYTVVVRNVGGSTTSREAFLAVAAPFPPRLLGCWRFDEGQGDQARDSSGLGLHGSLVGENGNVPVWVSGQPGFSGALEFWNNGADHSYVDVPASPNLRIGLTANDTWSVTAWAYEASDGGAYSATYGRFLAQDGGLGLQWDSGAAGDEQLYVWHNSLAEWRHGSGTEGPVVPLLDRWTHWALVYDAQTLTIYRDANQGAYGAKESIPLHAALDFPGYLGALQIGTQLNMDGTRNWSGRLDDVAVFAGALSELQARAVLEGSFAAFLDPTPLLTTTRGGGRLVVSWNSGVLQTSDDVANAWTDLPDARSPWALSPADARRFYRVRR